MMAGNPVLGASYLYQGLKLIIRPGIRRLVLIPLFINSLLFALLIWYGATQFVDLIEWLLPEWLDWLRWLLWPLFAVGVALAVFYTFILLANLIGAPFNGPLSEAVERHITGYRSPPGENGSSFFRDLVPSVMSEIRKLSYFFARAVPLLLLFLVPGINLAAPLLWMGFTSWMLALEYADYPMGNHGLPFSQQRLILREKPLLVLGFGGAVLLLTLIPFINFLAMPAAVAGATVLWVEEFARKNNKTI